MRHVSALMCCATTLLAVPPAAAAVDDVVAWCTFTGATDGDGRLRFAYGGHAVAVSTTGRVPLETVLTCTLESRAQGLPGEPPTLSESVSVAASGPVATAAGTTPAWPVRPVRVCATGYAVFDAIRPTRVDVRAECREATL